MTQNFQSLNFQAASHTTAKARILPKLLYLPFYSTPENHVSFVICIKMAEQVVRVCLKKQLKELSSYGQLLSSSRLLTWD